MRAALWLMTLFALAAAGAWLAGNNQGTVTLFLFPHRIDLSLNLAVLAVLTDVFGSADGLPVQFSKVMNGGLELPLASA